MKIKIITVLSLLLLGSLTINAAKNNSSINWKTADIKTLESGAKQDITVAIHELGRKYFSGLGVKQDYVKALELFRRSAAKGYPRSLHNIGCHYLNGLGIKKNGVEAAKWFTKAADKGYANSSYLLGYYYQEGQFVEQSGEKMYKYYKMAADQNHLEAQISLVISLVKGKYKSFRELREEAIKYITLAKNNPKLQQSKYSQTVLYWHKAITNSVVYPFIKDISKNKREK